MTRSLAAALSVAAIAGAAAAAAAIVSHDALTADSAGDVTGLAGTWPRREVQAELKNAMPISGPAATACSGSRPA